MRVTASVDGVKRVNFQVTHRVGGDDFARALCLEYRSEDIGSLPDLGRVQIEKVVRDALKRRPDSMPYWSDELEEDETEALWAWADGLVRRRFPELF